MSSAATGSGKPVRIGDVVIAVLLLAVFVLAYYFSQQWPFRARFFPQLLAGAGIAFSVLKLIGFAIQARRGRDTAAEPATKEVAGDDVELISEEEEEDQTLEYVFASAGGKAWARTLGWVFGFFVVLWLFGVFVAVPVFAFSYLKLEGRVGWIPAAVYALVAAGILYMAFRQFMRVPMPEGILL